MPRCYLDTNVLLDVAGMARPGHDAACRLMSSPDVERAVSAGSLKDFYYIAGNTRAGGICDADRRSYIRLFLDRADVIADDRPLMVCALESDEPDFEDGTKRAAAERWGADWIVSRDSARGAFAHSAIPRIEPIELVQRLGI